MSVDKKAFEPAKPLDFGVGAGAVAKSRFFNTFLQFLHDGCLETQFTPYLYRRLMYLFRHIAHTSQIGFYDAWFVAHKRAEWIAYAGRIVRPYADRAELWEDVELAIVKSLKSHPPVWLHEQQTLDRVRELLTTMSGSLYEDVAHLYRSGMINVSDYDTEGYSLGKILLAASIRRGKHGIHPLDHQEAEVYNLEKC